MRFKKHPLTLEVNRLSFDETKKVHKHSALFPNSLRCIVCGPSNCGKTSILLSWLLHPNGLRFKNLYIYSKSLSQPKYIFLSNVIQRVPGVECHLYTEREDIVTPKETLPHSIIIFDDVITTNQDVMRDYFSMGRHENVDSFYLAQTYTRIPKHLIRDNANFIVAFKQDDLNLKHIYMDHVASDMSFDDFKRLCKTCFNTSEHACLVIDKDSPLERGRYRCNIDSFIVDI